MSSFGKQKSYVILRSANLSEYSHLPFRYSLSLLANNVINHVPTAEQRGDWNRFVMQNEHWWMHMFESLTPRGRMRLMSAVLQILLLHLSVWLLQSAAFKTLEIFVLQFIRRISGMYNFTEREKKSMTEIYFTSYFRWGFKLFFFCFLYIWKRDLVTEYSLRLRGPFYHYIKQN